MSGGRVPFSKQDDEHLVAYLATHNPKGEGRSGNQLYKVLDEKSTGKWSWTERHPWQSWRDRYYRNSAEFDAKIRKYLKRRKDAQQDTEGSDDEAEGSSSKNLAAQAKRKRESDAAAEGSKRAKVEQGAPKKLQAKRSLPEKGPNTEAEDSDASKPPAKAKKPAAGTSNPFAKATKRLEEEEERQKQPQEGESKIASKKPQSKKRANSPPVPSSCSPKRITPGSTTATNGKIVAASANDEQIVPPPAQELVPQIAQPKPGILVKIQPRQKYTTKPDESIFGDPPAITKVAKHTTKPVPRPLPRIVDGPYKTSHIEDQRMDTSGDVPKLPIVPAKKPGKVVPTSTVQSAKPVTGDLPVVVDRPRRITIDREIQTGSPRVHAAKLPYGTRIPSPTRQASIPFTQLAPNPSPKPQPAQPPLVETREPSPVLLPPPQVEMQEPSPISPTAPLPAAVPEPEQEALPQPRATSLPRLPHSPNDPFFSSSAGPSSTNGQEKHVSPVDRRHSSPNPLGGPPPPLIDLRIEMSKRLHKRKSLAATRPSTSEPHILSHSHSRASSSSSVLNRSIITRSPSLPVLARDKKWLEQLGLERAIQLMAQQYGFHEDVIWDIWRAANDLEKTEELARKMRVGADAAVAEELGRLEDRNNASISLSAKQQNGHVSMEVSSRGTEDESDGQLKRLKSSPPSKHRRRSSGRFNLQIGPPKDAETMSEYTPPHGSRAGRYARLVREGRKDEALMRESKLASGSRRESFPLSITDYQGTPTSSSSVPLRQSALAREQRRIEAQEEHHRQRRRLASEDSSYSKPSEEDMNGGEDASAQDQDEEGEVAQDLNPDVNARPVSEQDETLPPSSPRPSTPVEESQDGDEDTEMDVEEDGVGQSQDSATESDEDEEEEEDQGGGDGEESDEDEGDDGDEGQSQSSDLDPDASLFTQRPKRPEPPEPVKKLKTVVEWDAKQVELLLTVSKKTAPAAKELEKDIHPDVLLQWTASQLSKFC
ncbi:hypothetical protein BDN72DRAFT_845652 [Pluteus cervinus]|uniref:Uncharacterized protein n=1 Tax=Pluteus cervinus TaxID=181527 RepID=A0ACD3AIF4_9AGAR|nr:hypothetical protein BDN72DRAFT_845652 [Pluteus cervinus]